jgi:hypothetical protein
MAMNKELVFVLGVMAYVKVLFWHLPVGCEEYHKDLIVSVSKWRIRAKYKEVPTTATISCRRRMVI